LAHDVCVVERKIFVFIRRNRLIGVSDSNDDGPRQDTARVGVLCETWTNNTKIEG
jgi:hypothetical protein